MLLCTYDVEGFPDSVSDDYPAYQLFDTVQAFASSMTGALATEAVLRGAGVGNEVLKDIVNLTVFYLFRTLRYSQLLSVGL